MRELRVEDALMYLDQVKMEFGDRPQIYNEFLEIMKTFKSQQIDTPGVIQRVSVLFHGNKRLVLGFNTFLPDGYKIELPMDGSGLAVYREPGRREAVQITWPGMERDLAISAQEEKQRLQRIAAQEEQTRQQIEQQRQQRQQQQQQQQGARPQGPPAGKMPAAVAAAAAAVPGGMKPSTPIFPSAPPAAAAAAAAVSGPPRPAPNMPPVQSLPANPPSAPTPPATAGQHVEFGHAINYVTTIKKRFASSPEIYRKFLEILHTYQKEQRGIKEVLDEVSVLFADHADLLKEFTYFLPDAVQGVAKRQLDEAARLAEERARLRGRGVKIPVPKGGAGKLVAPPPPVTVVKDPPVGVAKEEEEEVKPPSVMTPSRVPAAHVKKVPFGATRGRSDNEEMDICKGVVGGVVSFEPVRPPRRNELTPAQATQVYGRPKTIPPIPIEPNTLEHDFFEKVKAHFNRKDIFPDSAKGTTPSTRKNCYAEFVKCIHLFGMGVINKDELFQLLRGLMIQGTKGSGPTNQAVKPANAILAELEKVIMNRGPYAAQISSQKAKSKYGSHPLREYDVSETSRSITPSYFSYPSDFVFDKFSGETEKDASVINFECFCLAKDWIEKGSKVCKSLEEYDGVKVRHNANEGVMNRVEDEMHEVDMAIERNVMTMRLLEPIAEEMTRLKDQEEKAGQPIGRLQYKLKPRSLNSIHIGAIARVYGESGDEVIQHLLRNPLVVVPIVHKRMKEKDVEWRMAKTLLMKDWKEALKNCYRGSLDVKSYFYKSDLEKCVSDESLIEECQGPSTELQLLDIQQIQQLEFHNTPLPEMALLQPYLSVTRPTNPHHGDLYDLLRFRLSPDSASSQVESSTLGRVWKHLIEPWFGIKLCKSIVPNVKYTPGQQVKTTIGDGEIMSVQEGGDASDTLYRVKFSFGVGNVRSYSVTELLTSKDAPMPDSNTQPPQMQNDLRVLFGTKNMYIFLRLYVVLVTVLSKAKEALGDSQYRELLKLAKEKLANSDFDSLCRNIVGSVGASYILQLPLLVERFVNAISKMAKENVFVQLSDLSQLKLNDLNVLRMQSLKVTEEAVYRIQVGSNKMYFNYLPSHMELQLPACLPAASQGAGTLADIAAEPDQKRQKTGVVMESS